MAAAVGSPEDVRNLSHYVLSLSGSPHDSCVRFGQVQVWCCAACHGMDGKGNPGFGCPNLTDDIWLHGWGEAAITAMINNGKVNPDACAGRQADRSADQGAGLVCLGIVQQGAVM
jgi:cytochrome c oxidase cbb3-type subunit 3